ncbi:MAG: putative nucleotide sugar-phosphate transferase [Solirubrobacterales bacterium]|jgi:choline kinase|nr:putative nucleotide sugar-phosphate transferase [Solirubrobacterales bacterium]
MIGMVLAAGAGRRLQPDTDNLPKTLLPVDGERTILDVALHNLAGVGLEEVVVVTGFAADRIEERREDLGRRYGLRITTLFNPKAEEWNNAYSLWCARDRFAEGVLMVNGDTVHPQSVEEAVLAARGDDDLVIAVDDVKALGEEEMKVHLSAAGQLDRIHKSLEPATAAGEYIGVTLIEPHAADRLADALKATWEKDPQQYYEDGFQELADRGGRILAAPIGDVPWVEVDDHTDLARAREVACRY